MERILCVSTIFIPIIILINQFILTFAFIVAFARSKTTENNSGENDEDNEFEKMFNMLKFFHTAGR